MVAHRKLIIFLCTAKSPILSFQCLNHFGQVLCYFNAVNHRNDIIFINIGSQKCFSRQCCLFNNVICHFYQVHRSNLSIIINITSPVFSHV